MGEPEPPVEPGRHPAGRNLPVAIATALGLAALIFGTLFTSKLAWFVVVSWAVLYAQVELYRVLRARGFRPAATLGVAAGTVLLLGAYERGVSALSFGVSATVVASFLWFLVEPERSQVSERIAATLLGVLYVPFLGAHVVLLRNFADGAVISIAYIGLVAFYDIGAFAAGSLFGKHPIAPTVSPRKTWEGALGATLFIFVLALLVGPMLGPFDAADSAILAGATAVFAPLGDLVESLLKRDLQVKDMGSLLPGHGGMLDRIDALLMMAPVMYWLVRGVVL